MADEDEVVVLQHPDVKDDEGHPVVMTFRQSDGFWPDKLGQIEVYRAAGWKDASKATAKAALEPTPPAESK